MQTEKSLTVSQIVAETPAAARVFDGHRIDHAGGGKDPLETACRKAGGPADLNDWHTAPMRDLISHIIDAHHTFLDVQLPLLENKISRAAGIH